MPTDAKNAKLDDTRIAELKSDIGPEWTLVGGHLARSYMFPDFANGLAFVNQVGRLAEVLNHHPVVQLAWGQVRLEMWTHSVDGLTPSDFQLARQADEAFGRMRNV